MHPADRAALLRAGVKVAVFAAGAFTGYRVALWCLGPTAYAPALTRTPARRPQTAGVLRVECEVQFQQPQTREAVRSLAERVDVRAPDFQWRFDETIGGDEGDGPARTHALVIEGTSAALSALHAACLEGGAEFLVCHTEIRK